MGPTQRHIRWIPLDKASGMWSWPSSFEIKSEWSPSSTPLCIFVAWTETALQNVWRAGQTRANYANYEIRYLEKCRPTRDKFKKRHILCRAWCICLYIYVFHIYIYLLSHSFSLLFIYFILLFIRSFVRPFASLLYSLIHLLVDWFNGWLLISSPVNTELIPLKRRVH
jgi:hypothetical protein